MKLSDMIAETCCGALADKQVMYDEAVRMELQLDTYESALEDMEAEISELEDACDKLQEVLSE